MVKHSFFALVFLAACNVSPAPPSTGGLPFDGGPPPDAASSCERAVAVVTSDYKSTNIVVSSLDGVTQSQSFVSSGAAKPGLALALSGDVDVPFTAPGSKRVVILDRYGTNVITWMDLGTAGVIAQLPVGTGFQSNPHDYLDVDARRAYVTRYGTNPSPGAQPFDQGGDLLVLDTEKFAITGRIPMPEDDPGLQACPDAMTWLRGQVVVSLGRWSADFSRTGNGRFIALAPATNRIVWSLDIPGLQACGRLAVSPSGDFAAVACSSKLDMGTQKFDPKGSDIVLYDTTVLPPKEIRRFDLGKKLDAGLQPTLTFASDERIFALTYGGNGKTGDTALALNTTTGEVTQLVEAPKAYVLGGMHCAPGCSDVCLLGDAQRNRLRRWHVTPEGRFDPLEDTVLDTLIGLPPRSLGGL